MSENIIKDKLAELRRKEMGQDDDFAVSLLYKYRIDVLHL